MLFSTSDSRLRTIFHRDAAGSVTEMLVRDENRAIVYQRER